MKPWSAKYVALFALIQTISLVLTLVGYPLIAVLATFKFWDLGVTPTTKTKYEWRGGKLTWIWGNSDDGIFGNGPITRLQAFYWSAVRNPASNLRHIPGISQPGRPFFRITLGSKPGGFYCMCGWLGSTGYPVLSAGRNVNSY